MAKAYNNREYMYFLTGDVARARADVQTAVALGYPVNQKFIEDLQKTPPQ